MVGEMTRMCQALSRLEPLLRTNDPCVSQLHMPNSNLILEPKIATKHFILKLLNQDAEREGMMQFEDTVLFDTGSWIQPQNDMRT